MPLSKLYTDLVWTKKVRGIRDVNKKMKSLLEILNVEGAGEKRLNVLVEGKKLEQRAKLFFWEFFIQIVKIKWKHKCRQFVTKIYFFQPNQEWERRALWPILVWSGLKNLVSNFILFSRFEWNTLLFAIKQIKVKNNKTVRWVVGVGV